MAVDRSAWLDAQYSVLGSALIDDRCVPMIMHRVREEDFSGGCRTLFAAMRKLFQQGKVVDPVSVGAVVGSDYRSLMLEMMDITPSAANVETYLDICHRQAQVRQLQEIGAEMSQCEDPERLQELTEAAASIRAEKTGVKIMTMADAMEDFMTRHAPGVITHYLSWPIRQLNPKIYSEPGDFIILGGRPSTGKTAFSIQCGWHWAEDQKVGYFSLETSPAKVNDRNMVQILQLTMQDVKKNQIGQQQWDKFGTRSADILARHFEIIPAAGFSVADIRAYAMMRRYDIVIIDYLQLISSRGVNRVEQVTNISLGLHTMAQSLGITVMALSQMSRKQDGSRGGDMSQLRESGQIEQDADIVLLMELEDEQKPDGLRILHIAKNKEGTRPKIKLGFDGSRQTFFRCGSMEEFEKQMEKRNAGDQFVQAEIQALPDDTPTPFE